MEKLHGSLRWMRWLALACLLAGAASSSIAAKTYSDNGDGTVTDPTTGLTWMRCSMGQTWDGTTCTGTASIYTFDQANALTGTVTFAGKDDWRLPNIRELQTIVDRSQSNRAIDSGAFPNTSGRNFWSGSPYANGSIIAWYVDFSNGHTYSSNRYYSNGVRLVRGGLSLGLLDNARPSTDYIDQGDGSVTHTPTSLTWQRCAVGQTWNGSTCSGTASLIAWNAAKLLTSTFAGQTDWRLPTEEELLSLVDYSKVSPSINSTLFPNTSSSLFWSGTPGLGYPGLAWDVSFIDGGAKIGSGYDSYGVRLVRGGQSFGPLVLSASKTGAGQVTNSRWPVYMCDALLCSGGFNAGEVTTLNANPAVNLIAWGGACASAGAAPTCTLTMDAAKTVSASFRDTSLVTGLPPTLTFATQNMASTSTAQIVTLRNAGTATLNITGIVVNGDFAVANTCGAGLGVGGSCTLDVTFKPTTSGSLIGTLTLTTDAPGSPHSVNLTGTGQGALALLSASSKTFASQNLGTTSAAQTITLSNIGGAMLNISSIVVTGDFAVTTICGAVVVAGGSCTLAVTFKPIASGTRTGTLTIITDSPGSPHSISLDGTSQGALATLSATSKTFASQAQGTTSAPQTITLSNTGGAVLNISSIAVTGDFAKTTTCSATLAVAASCTINVTFNPTSTGPLTGNVVITSDASNSPNTVTLTGTGLAVPVLSLSSTLLSFTATAIGSTSAVQSIKLTNTGAAALSLTSITTSGDFAATHNCGSGLGPAGFCNLSITFTPTVAGNRVGTLIIASNAPGSPHTVALSGSLAIPVTSTMDLLKGWNLLGNGQDQTLPVTTLFGDPVNVTTVWKWDVTQSGWQFYAPSMDAAALQTYATGKGYGVLSTINPGEGFWVNAVQAFTVSQPSGTAIVGNDFSAGKPYALKLGWNLVATGTDVTPSAFNTSLSATPPSPGTIPINLTTLWAWDSTQSKWYFYAPSLDVGGGLAAYITGKGYLDFTASGKTLGNGVGFWVNRP